MKKAKSLLYSLDVIFATLLILIQLKLVGGITYPDQADFVGFLINCRTVIFVVFIICIIMTITIRWIYNDVKEDINYLHTRISELEKKVDR